MAYDEGLADRVRDLIAPIVPFEERKMFGGLAFMINTHMACGIVHDGLMVRVGKAGHDAALARGAREMDFTGRPMRSMVIVPGADLRQDSDLEPWVSLAVEFAQSEPPKPTKKPSPLSGDVRRRS
jgi:TfoX/Sxy family transcriptional regulator of competence genes